MENIQFREKTCYLRWQPIIKWGHIQNFSILALNTETLFAKYCDLSIHHIEFEHWVLDGSPWPKTDGFCDLLGIQFLSYVFISRGFLH